MCGICFYAELRVLACFAIILIIKGALGDLL